MNKRLVLGGIIRAMLIMLGLAFLFVLFRSLSGPAVSASNSETAFDDVVIGQTAIRRLGRDRFWVTRLSNVQRRQVTELSEWLVDAEAGCDLDASLCIIKAESLRAGIDLVYSFEPPKQLPRSAQWYGGFVDPTSGAVFDFMGRAYKGIKSEDKRLSLSVQNKKIPQ